MKNNNIKFLTLTALLIALTYIATSLIKIPIPYGYVNLGFCFLMTATYFFGTKSGLLAGSIGSSLADLLSPYAIWTLPTFIIKILIALVMGLILNKSNKPKKLYGISTFLAVFLGSLIHIVGYTLATGIIEGNLYAALATAPALFLECVVNAVAFFALAIILKRMNLPALIQKA